MHAPWARFLSIWLAPGTKAGQNKVCRQIGAGRAEIRNGCNIDAIVIHNGSGDGTDSALPLEARQPVLGGTQIPRQASLQVPGTPAGITRDQP